MKHYLKIYLRLLKLNFGALISYRANLLNNIFSALLWGFFQLTTILILTSKTNLVFGWTRVELIFLVALFNVFIGFYHFFFTRNFERFAQVINLGQLDPILLKPVNSQFLLSFWLASFAALLRVLIGLGVILFIVNTYHLEISFIQIIQAALIMTLSLTTIYSFWFSIMTLTVWFSTLSNLSELMYTSNSFARLPKEAFSGIRNIAIYIVLPLTLIVCTPAKLLLNKPYQTDLILLIIFAFLLFFTSRYFWKFALKFYSSAGG